MQSRHPFLEALTPRLCPGRFAALRSPRLAFHPRDQCSARYCVDDLFAAGMHALPARGEPDQVGSIGQQRYEPRLDTAGRDRPPPLRGCGKPAARERVRHPCRSRRAGAAGRGHRAGAGRRTSHARACPPSHARIAEGRAHLVHAARPAGTAERPRQTRDRKRAPSRASHIRRTVSLALSLMNRPHARASDHAKALFIPAAPRIAFGPTHR